jgi:hypothetical protein
MAGKLVRPIGLRYSAFMTNVLVDGAAIVYRLFDVGYSIRLDDASRTIAESAPARVPARERPARVEARALQIANPPLALSLGRAPLVIDGKSFDAELSARLYDFGVCALRLQVDTPPGLSWQEFSLIGRALDTSGQSGTLMRDALTELLARLRDAIERPAIAPVVEEYAVFRVYRLCDEAGKVLSVDAIGDAHLVPLLLGEDRSLSDNARRELLQHRFSYYADDLAILTWDNALVVDPNPHDRDVEYVLEFANAQLLELRMYDALLDAELPSMYDRVEVGRRRRLPLLTHGFRPIIAALQTRVADVTETVERVENALKVTEDVYLARIYATALELFRGQTWRRGIERKLAIFRETYAMLNAESQASRAEVMEAAIVLLIVAELLVGLLRA